MSTLFVNGNTPITDGYDITINANSIDFTNNANVDATNYIDSIINRISDRITMSDKTHRIKVLSEKREELQKVITQIDSCIEQGKKLKYKIGDVVFHPEHGAIIINDIVVNMYDEFQMSEAKKPYTFYYKGYSKQGTVSIEAEKTLPYNEATAILWQGKNETDKSE